MNDNEMEDNNWLANDTSFDAFVRNTLGSNEENKSSAGIGMEYE